MIPITGIIKSLITLWQENCCSFLCLIFINWPLTFLYIYIIITDINCRKMLGEVVKKLEKRSIKKESLERILDEFIKKAKGEDIYV